MQKPNLFSLPNFIILLLLSLSIFHSLQFEPIKISNSNTYNDWYYPLFCIEYASVTNNFASQIQCSDIANFASGIVFGLGKFTQEFKSDYKSLGLIHLIVASGTQVKYLFSSVEWLLVQLGVIKKIRYIFFVICCATLFFIIGFTPPLIRASIFIGIIVTLTTFFGRYLHPLRALIFAIIIILTIYPALFYSLSLWLSCLASLAVIISAEFKNNYVFPALQDNLFVTILLLPILSQFNTSINVITIPLNIILAIILPYLIGVLLFCFLPVFGIIFRIISVFTLSLLIGIIDSLANLTGPYFTISFVKMNQVTIIYYYIFLVLIFTVLYIYKTRLFNSQLHSIDHPVLE